MEWERQRAYDFESGKEAGIAIGKEAGAEQKAVEAAHSLYENGVSLEVIAKSLNMTPEQVKEIVKDLVPMV